MKKVFLFVTLLIGSVSFGQIIMVNGSPYLATQNNSFPFWLDAGSTLSTNPPMNFISVVEYNENEIEDDKNLGYSKVLSITESSVVPDGKVWKVISALQYHYEGCTDETMFNFDPQANVDDGSCVEMVYGCINENYVEYNSSANVDDGSCLTSAIFGCMDNNYLEFNLNANVDNGSCATINIQIGTEAFGGLIFYVEPDSSFVLVLAKENVQESMWGCEGADIPGADGTELGSGWQNTLDIIAANCNDGNNSAEYCMDYEHQGYVDWYLPSYDELTLAFSVLIDIPNLISDAYNTSSEYSDPYQYNYCSNYPNQHINKTDPNRVRPIRTHFF